MTKLAAPYQVVYRTPAVRFLVIGGLSFLVDFGALWVLLERGVVVPVAASIAWSTGFGINYTLNRVWTFDSDTRVTRSLFRYGVLAAGNLLITAGGLTAVAWLGIPVAPTKVVFTLTLSVVNFSSVPGVGVRGPQS